jgi:ubiquinone/menaquinone biosynthesis C-methylase UbiE
VIHQTPEPTNSAQEHPFKSLERDTWQRGAGDYDHLFSPVTREAIQPLLDALGVGAGQRLLDVCSGTGHGVGAALERGAIAEGIDLAPAMVAIAQDAYPQGRFAVGDGEALPYARHTFDAVSCLFGLNHLPDQPRALAEAYRVLRPGGSYGFTMWCPPGPSVFHALVQDALQRHGTPVPAPAMPSPALRFGEPGPCSQALLEAGFADPQVQELPLAFALESAETLLALARTSPRVSRQLSLQPEAQRKAIETAILSTAETYRCDNVLRIPIPALLCVGRVPPDPRYS